MLLISAPLCGPCDHPVLPQAKEALLVNLQERIKRNDDAAAELQAIRDNLQRDGLVPAAQAHDLQAQLAHCYQVLERQQSYFSTDDSA